MSAHPALADRIADLAPRLAEEVAADFAADAFWTARFGPDAAAMLRAQMVGHAERLARALRVGDAAPVTERMRTVRDDSVRLGLTTRHLVLGCARLEEAIRAAELADWGPARTMLDRAVLALRYDEPTAAAAVQDASRQLAEDAVVTLRGVHLGEVTEEARWIAALEILVSYLADALGQGDATVLSGHARWLAGAPAGPARPAPARAMLDALAGALDELPPAAHVAAFTCLTEARATAGLA